MTVWMNSLTALFEETSHEALCSVASLVLATTHEMGASTIPPGPASVVLPMR